MQPTPPRTVEEQRQAIRDKMAAARQRRIVGRIPLYQAALGALRAGAVAGQDPKTYWPKEFAPLTPEERKVVRERYLEALERHAAGEASLRATAAKGAP